VKKKATISKIPPLATGQLWQMKDCCLQVTHVGKLLAEYKIMRAPGQRAAQSRMDNLASIVAYLKKNKAKLVANPVEPGKPPA
jgi:hypothetical protein